MLSVEEKLHNMLVAALEENIRFDMRLLADEQDEIRKKYIQDLIVLLKQKLAQEKGYEIALMPMMQTIEQA